MTYFSNTTTEGIVIKRGITRSHPLRFLLTITRATPNGNNGTQRHHLDLFACFHRRVCLRYFFVAAIRLSPNGREYFFMRNRSEAITAANRLLKSGGGIQKSVLYWLSRRSGVRSFRSSRTRTAGRYRIVL